MNNVSADQFESPARGSLEQVGSYLVEPATTAKI